MNGDISAIQNEATLLESNFQTTNTNAANVLMTINTEEMNIIKQ